MSHWLMRFLKQQPFARWFGLGFVFLAPWFYAVLIECVVHVQRWENQGALSRLVEWQSRAIETGWYHGVVVLGWCSGICMLAAGLCAFIVTRLSRDARLRPIH